MVISKIIQTNKESSVCCSGDSSCYNSTIKHISISGVDNYVGNGDISVIRCDGAYSCESCNLINGRINGNILITGYAGGQYSKIEAIDGNIIISSKNGGEGSDIIGGNNLYVTGLRGLRVADINIINNNVYYLASLSGIGAKHNIIGGVLYCLAYQACLYTQINDVQNVVCEGEGSCSYTRFNSMRNSLFAIGDNALNGAKIVANHGRKFNGNIYDNYFILSVNGDMSENYNLTCKSNMFCYVLCGTINSCSI